MLLWLTVYTIILTQTLYFKNGKFISIFLQKGKTNNLKRLKLISLNESVYEEATKLAREGEMKTFGD